MTAAGATPRGEVDGEGLASIGSVLDALRADFPEITISKIRFLESEGLISPARTPSGYRQFTPVDVRRLRFVLSAQRDHYLPLKVIRARLAEFDADPSVGEPSLPGSDPVGAPAGTSGTSGPAGPAAPVPSPSPVPHRAYGDPRGPSGPRAVPAPASPTTLLPRPGGPGSEPTAVPSPTPSPDPVGAAPAASPPGPVTRAQLLAEDGVDEALLGALETHGVLRAESDGTYEPGAVAVAGTAAAFAALGVEPRLLRGLRAGADREVGLLTQLVTPVARHRGADAARNAEDLCDRLADLSGRLHGLLVEAGLRRGLRR